MYYNNHNYYTVHDAAQMSRFRTASKMSRSAEFQTFVAHQEEVGDLVQFGFTSLLDALTSKDVIAWADRQSNELTGLGYGTRAKTGNLLNIVGTQIQQNTEKFYDFKNILAKEPSYSNLVKKLSEFAYIVLQIVIDT